MPLFFFDVSHEGRLSLDTEGTELADLEAATEEAVQTMAEMSADAIPGKRSQQITMFVRDSRGVRLLELDLAFAVREVDRD